MHKILMQYERDSGKAITFQKSGIFFSKNVTSSNRELVSGIVRVHSHLNTGKYLGLIGKSKREVFGFLKDRLRARTQGWQNKLLTQAGKEILIKAVSQAIPSYCMSNFLLPKTINWACWYTLCRGKYEGGLGFKTLSDFNLAMFGKQGWKLISKPDSLVARVLKAKYYNNYDFLLGMATGRGRAEVTLLVPCPVRYSPTRPLPHTLFMAGRGFFVTGRGGAIPASFRFFFFNIYPAPV